MMNKILIESGVRTRWKSVPVVVNNICRLHSQLCKKDLSHPMETNPVVSEVERGWYEWWEKNSFFKRKNAESKFVMLLPPPNVTGKLHMGHAVTCTLQDAIIRWNQMRGKEVIWVPGCDHAGIATQVVVERNLAQTKGVTREELGREKFVEEVWRWKEDKQETINAQMKRLGVALDWDRAYFTLDQNLSTSVTEAFVRLFDSGLISRSNYVINWCCALQSAISDFEVEMTSLEGPVRLPVPGHRDPVSFGYMYDLRYRVLGSDETVTVSTTRPETVLGDTALMVHPDDPRYVHLHGGGVEHPFRGDRIPIITDTSVDTKLGTGVVKVTPGHSFQDFEVGQRHLLPSIEIFDDRGWVKPGFGPIPTQPRYEARESILAHLSTQGLRGDTRPHAMLLPRCSRTGDVIEPRLKAQWFLSMASVSRKAVSEVEGGRLRLEPPEMRKVWNHFLEGGRDWCLSRQLWWGHRAPVYWASVRKQTCYGSEEEVQEGVALFVAAGGEEEARLKAAKKLGVAPSVLWVERETDVLDTWFSSALLPLAVFGWPLRDPRGAGGGSPLSLMETGHDILFFWVARMVMMSLQLTGELPFQDVLFHGLVCDSQGHKMSKSKGNALDPLDVIEGYTGEEAEKTKPVTAYGADALRFSICLLDLKKQHISVDLRLVEHSHLFRNKIWQTVRFLRHNQGAIPGGEECMEGVRELSVDSVMDRWLMSHLSQMVSDAHQGFSTYTIHLAANAFRKFWQSHLCDVYLESCKPRLWNHASHPDSASQCLRVLWTSVHTGLVALAPFMPFLSEELYARVPAKAVKEESILRCSYPHPEDWEQFRDPTLENDVAAILQATSVLRNLRKSYNITSKAAQGRGSILIGDDRLRATGQNLEAEVQRLSFLSEVRILGPDSSGAETEPGLVVHPVAEGVTAHLHLQGMIAPEVEVERLSRKVSKVEKERLKYEARVLKCQRKGKEPFDNDVGKLTKLTAEIETLNGMLKNVRRLM